MVFWYVGRIMNSSKFYKQQPVIDVFQSRVCFFSKFHTENLMRPTNQKTPEVNSGQAIHQHAKSNTKRENCRGRAKLVRPSLSQCHRDSGHGPSNYKSHWPPRFTSQSPVRSNLRAVIKDEVFQRLATFGCLVLS